MNDIAPFEDKIDMALDKANVILSKSYLQDLSSPRYSIITNETNTTSLDFFNNINKTVRFYDITKIVLNKNENMRDKLVSVFNAVGTYGASLLMLIQGDETSVSIKFGVKVQNNSQIGGASTVLENSIKGNFPGTTLQIDNLNNLQDTYSKLETTQYVTCVSTLPGKRSEEETKDRQFVQGIEKFIDTMQGKKYSLLLIADPISLTDLNNSKQQLENLYSALSSLSETEYSMGTSESESISKSVTDGLSNTISSSITSSTTTTVGQSTSTTKGKSSGTAKGKSWSLFGLFGGNKSSNKGTNSSVTNGFSSSTSSSSSSSSSTSHTTSTSTTNGNTSTLGESKNIQIKLQNHTVKRMMDKIDENLKRYDNCADLGMWNCAAYCIAPSGEDANTAASIYHSIIRGSNSSLDNGAIIPWDKKSSSIVTNYLRQMEHPLFHFDGGVLTAGNVNSSSELSLQASLPNHSVPGIPVIECAQFGRSVSQLDNDDNKTKIKLGNIFHMYNSEAQSVTLDYESLTSHTFITGSTGSGKSNTIYKLIKECKKKGSHFLVIEPAKGEYKNIFGNDVSVYGTNPNITQLLRINPFSFPKEIHILEHVERLVEIFNACWPMYAAMPNILQDAIMTSYEDAGWNLTTSVNSNNENYYPCFDDIQNNIRKIIDSSEYDSENKGAYKGSLLTRLKSLSTGINSLIFTRDEIADEMLFDNDVIVDISRLGSTETKSLIMGLLILKLQEHRMITSSMNNNLQHITILEEAHNLLKKTSTDQSQESSNIAGKAVEMLTNAIAEMRTYGEGFIIADQAPNLLDKAVIRNTNTKIILSLPDFEDRELVGRASNLNEEQINELSKLPTGVAAIYQKGWTEAVLCKVDKADVEENEYKKPEELKSEEIVDNTDKKILIADYLCNGKKIDIDKKKEVQSEIDKLNIKDSSKNKILTMLCNGSSNPDYEKISSLVADLFPDLKDAFHNAYVESREPRNWSLAIYDVLCDNYEIDNGTLKEQIIQCVVTHYLLSVFHDVEEMRKWKEEGTL